MIAVAVAVAQSCKNSEYAGHLSVQSVPIEIPILPELLTMATVTQTTNFIYTYDDTLLTADKTEATARANALAASCEADLTTLQGWFGVSGGFGASNQVTVLITKRIAGLGWNGGYQTGGQTQIQILPFTGAIPGLSVCPIFMARVGPLWL